MSSTFMYRNVTCILKDDGNLFWQHREDRINPFEIQGNQRGIDGSRFFYKGARPFNSPWKIKLSMMRIAVYSQQKHPLGAEMLRAITGLDFWEYDGNLENPKWYWNSSKMPGRLVLSKVGGLAYEGPEGKTFWHLRKILHKVFSEREGLLEDLIRCQIFRGIQADRLLGYDLYEMTRGGIHREYGSSGYSTFSQTIKRSRRKVAFGPILDHLGLEDNNERGLALAAMVARKKQHGQKLEEMSDEFLDPYRKMVIEGTPYQQRLMTVSEAIDYSTRKTDELGRKGFKVNIQLPQIEAFGFKGEPA